MRAIHASKRGAALRGTTLEPQRNTWELFELDAVVGGGLGEGTGDGIGGRVGGDVVGSNKGEAGDQVGAECDPVGASGGAAPEHDKGIGGHAPL